MNQMTVRMLIFWSLVACAAVGYHSCTLVGGIIGALSDSATPDSTVVRSWDVVTLERGTPVSVLLTDGKSFRGIFLDVVQMPEQDYARQFAERQKQWPPETSIPNVGDSLTVTFTTGGTTPCVLVAYDLNYIWVKRKQNPDPFAFPVGRIASVETKDGVETMEEFTQRLSRAAVPHYSQVSLQTDWKPVRIDLSDIQQVSYANAKHGLVTGLVVGAVIDVVVLAIIATGDNEDTPSSSSPPPSSGGGSCPFVYSFDGRDYVLDSETFGGAIIRALQRTDYDNLDHLVETDGLCRLKIANELDETQYVDDLRLLVVDHPKATTIVPSLTGELRVFAQPQKPVQAHDLSGSNVTGLVASTDHQWWISNPFSHDPGFRATARDGITLSFARPSGASSAKIAVNALNTLWAIEIEAHLLGLVGHDLDRWYATMNGSASARASFVESVKREAMLAVSAWDGQSWVPAGTLWFVGPHVAKTQTLALNLSQLPEGDLRLRLESTAGLWMVNSVSADFTPELPVTTTELLPTTARDADGNELREVLSDIDEQYVVLETGERADITFAVPPPLTDMERSYVLKSTGYYTIHVSADGAPKHDLVQQFGDVPGAFGTYSVRLLNASISSRVNTLAASRDQR